MRKARVLAVGAVAVLAACGGGGGDDGGGTTEPSVFSSLEVNPPSVTLLVGETSTLAAVARDQKAAAMSGLTVQYQTSDASKATVNASSGLVTGVAAGTATITATGTVGTVVKTKTVNVTVTVPGPTAAVTANAQSKFDPATVAITAGGTVTWSFAGLEHNVTFDGTAPQGGNIPNTSTGTQSRTFAAVGTYNYHCTIHAGMTGQVLVK